MIGQARRLFSIANRRRPRDLRFGLGEGRRGTLFAKLCYDHSGEMALGGPRTHITLWYCVNNDK